MKKFITFAFALITMLILGMQPAEASKRTRSVDEDPIITIHTDAYKEVGPTNSFGLILGATETDFYDIDAGFGMQEVEVEPWRLENGSISGTYKSIQVSEDGLIRVYGDPEKIDLIRIEGAFVTEIEMEQCRNLEVLDLSHNSLRRLDLTPFTNLYAIYLSDNPFTKESPLKIGAPKNQLAILEIDIVKHLDQSFNLSDYPSIQVFDAYANPDLWTLDPTGCPELLSLSLDGTSLSTIDLSKNPKLISLDISSTRITELDISHNHELQILMATHISSFVNQGYDLNGIDLSAQPKLRILNLGGNSFENINLSNNPDLTNLNLSWNKLTQLDLSHNTNLYSVNILHNNLTFATLPEPQPTWGEYFYLQNNIKVAKSIDFNNALDLSTQVLRPGTETTAKVWQKMTNGNDTIINPTLYTFSEGVVKFNQALPDSVYVRYSNSLLSEYDMYTTPFMVKAPEDMDTPLNAITFIPAQDMETLTASVGMDSATAEHPVKFSVDFGDGILKEFHAASSHIPADPNIIGAVRKDTPVRIFMHEGTMLTAFSLCDKPLASVDVQNAHSLRELRINNSGLTEIDLRYNRCLEDINLDGNLLTGLDLAGVYMNWEKHVLYNLSAAHNRLDSVAITSPQQMKRIVLKGNRLTDLPLKDYDRLEHLDLSDNDFSGEMSLVYLMNCDTIDLSGNRLKRIVYDTFDHLKLLDISRNLFNLQTLPLSMETEKYVYAPQKPMEILKNAPAINLSDQYITIDGKSTTFVWKKEDGTILTEGSDITCKDGATRFLKDDLGKVFCELTNPAFPQFTGDNVLRTTPVNVMGAPTTVIATFTTLEDSEEGVLGIAADIDTSIFIDWRGDGTEFIPYYAMKDDERNHYSDIRTYRDAEVKVYTYDDPSDLTLFNVSNVRMGRFDGSPMTGLDMIGLSDTGLTDDAIILPESHLNSISLPGNRLTKLPYNEKYADIIHLQLSGNLFTSIDLTPYKNLRTLYLSHNRISDIKFDNPKLWELALNGNGMKSLDLTGLKNLEQLWLGDNRLSEIKLLPFRGSMRVIDLSANRFTFETLPAPTDYPNLARYYYGNQENIEAIVSEDGMTFDLSSQATVKGIYETVYTWFLGEPVFDAEEGTLSGEILYADDEYTIEGGVTTFNTRFSDDVVCVMTNDLFPRGFLRTPAYRVGTTAVEAIENPKDAMVDVYTLSGSIVRRNVESGKALDGLRQGIYIVGGKKVFVHNN